MGQQGTGAGAPGGGGQGVDKKEDHDWRRAIVPLSEEESWLRLQSTSMGRVALTVRALPVIFPVFYGLVDQCVVFRASRGTSLSTASPGAVVAFEAGEFVPDAEEAWSVMIRGVAQEITHPEQLDLARSLPLRAMTGTRDHDTLIAIPASTLDGRIMRFG